MKQLLNLLNKHWYIQINPILSLLLLPSSIIFFFISRVRYWLYKFNILASYKLPVPVIVIGNISVGGVGKTPITKMIASELENLGIKTGIILRGYKGSSKHAQIVSPTSASKEVGDEALLYALAGLKVAIGSNRYHAAMKLLETYADIKVILSDDGLQHYRLQRDYEIAVVATNSIAINRFILPMGCLRETISRLNTVGAIIVSADARNNDINDFYHTQGSKYLLPYKNKLYFQRISLDKIYNAVSLQQESVTYFKDKPVIAMTAIGNPQRFFDFIDKLPIAVGKIITFADHYHYLISDVPRNSIVMVTEKDYTKLYKFKLTNIWVVAIKVDINDNGLIKQIASISTNTDAFTPLAAT